MHDLSISGPSSKGNRRRKTLIPEVVDKVAVGAILNPFEPEPVKFTLSEEGTVADILAASFPGVPREIAAKIRARIFVDDLMVLDSERELVRPRAGQFVSIRLSVEGQQNKGIASILGLVVAIAAAYSTYGVSTSAYAIGELGASGAFAAGAAAGATVSLVGSLAVRALIPPPVPPKLNYNTSPATFTVSSNSNIAAPLAPIPVILGTRLVAPMLAATPYTHYLGSEQFLRMIFVIGQGPLDISALRIQDTLLEAYADVEWEFRAGYPDDPPITLYPGSVFESVFSLNLSTGNVNAAPTLSGWQQQTSGTNADQLAVVVSFPAFEQIGKGNGQPVALSCAMQIRWAPTGTTSWINEPNIVINSTASGQVTKAHTWSVPRGQYDVQVQLTQFNPYKGDWTNPYSANGSWTELDTIRGQAPYAISGLAMIALNIRASRQLNGVISNLYAIVSSILRDYNPATTLWDDRAGSWFYDYDNQGAGASVYALDAANALDTTATTGTNFIANERIGIADNTTATFKGALSSVPVQPGSLIISVGNGNSATSTTGRRHTAAPSALQFITDDGKGNLSGPGVVSGSTDYFTGAYSITLTTAPLTGNDVVCDYVQLVRMAGAGRALAITTASGSDGAAVASKSVGVIFHLADYFTGIPVPTQFQISGWYKASQSIAAGIRLRAVFGVSEDPLTTDVGITSQDIIANGAATTAYQQAIATITAPPNAKWMRIVAYHNPDAVGGVTVWWDRMGIVPMGPQISANVNQLPNPSFDFPGVVTSNPASHFRHVCVSNALKIPIARLDLPTLQIWWQDNVTNGRYFNGIFDSPGTVFDVLRAVAAMGRASYAMRNGLHSVVFDKPQTTPIQHLTPRNSYGFKSSKAFPNLPQGLKVRFTNPANNYQPDEILVYDDAPAGGLYTAGGSNAVQLWESLDLTKTCTDPIEAWKQGRYVLAQGRLRPEVYEMAMDFENLVATRGDYILASHDIPEWGGGWGRVKAIQLNALGYPVGITADESSWTYSDGMTYVLRFRLSATGATLTQTLLNPATGTGGSVATNQANFAFPMTATPYPSVGDLVMFGVLGSETAPLLITKVTPAKNLSAILTLVDYAAGVYTADASPPPFVSIGPAPGATAPIVVSANSSNLYSLVNAEGIVQPRIYIQLAPISGVASLYGAPIAIEYQTRVTAGSELNQRGAYNSGTTYNAGDEVSASFTYMGTVLSYAWMCSVDGTIGVTPGTNGAIWTIVDEGTEWTIPARVPVAVNLLILLVQAGTIYDVQIRYIYPQGAFSAWTLLSGHFVAAQPVLQLTWQDYTATVPLTALAPINFATFFPLPSPGIIISRMTVTLDGPAVACVQDAILALVPAQATSGNNIFNQSGDISYNPTALYSMTLTSGAGAMLDSGPLSIGLANTNANGLSLQLTRIAVTAPGSGVAPLGAHVTIYYTKMAP